MNKTSTYIERLQSTFLAKLKKLLSEAENENQIMKSDNAGARARGMQFISCTINSMEDMIKSYHEGIKFNKLSRHQLNRQKVFDFYIHKIKTLTDF